MGDCCTATKKSCLVRGDTWTLDVGLSSAYAEVIENPTEWEMLIVFRESQHDDVAPYLTDPRCCVYLVHDPQGLAWWDFARFERIIPNNDGAGIIVAVGEGGSAERIAELHSMRVASNLVAAACRPC